MIKEAIAANQEEAAAYAPAVRAWMAVMALSFMSSVIFIFWKSGARWVLTALVINMLGLIVIKALFPAFTRTGIGTVVHLVFWSFVIFMIWRPRARARRTSDFMGSWGKVYFAWLVGVTSIMFVSLILDARTAILWIF